jgi:nicotinamidase-related amidase
VGGGVSFSADGVEGGTQAASSARKLAAQRGTSLECGWNTAGRPGRSMAVDARACKRCVTREGGGQDCPHYAGPPSAPSSKAAEHRRCRMPPHPPLRGSLSRDLSLRSSLQTQALRVRLFCEEELLARPFATVENGGMFPRTIVAFVLAGWMSSSALAQDLYLHARERAETKAGSEEFRAVEKVLNWEARKTALVICDMWDTHTCPNSAARVSEMAPRVNELAKAARTRGVLIIHCPSDTMEFYKDHPGRKLAQAAPVVESPVPLQRWCKIDPTREAALPIDDTDGGCDGERTWKKGDPYPWTRQHAAIEIAEGDAITDSAEAYNLMRQRGIENVIVCGVHLNMCVLGRPFAIRQMVMQGQRVALVRDLTDTMYNPERAPQVSHFAGTRLMVEHVEKYWCPSITSAALLGGAPFRFRGDGE